jgi:hypothetical protein
MLDALPPALRRRRLRLFGIGSPKSGTHSLAGVFEANYRTAHEPEDNRLADLIVAVREGTAMPRDLTRYLRGRERRLRLEVNSAGLNGLVVEHLVPLSARARFVLTIRDPYSWLESLIDHCLRGSPSAGYLKLRELQWGGHPRPRAEQALADRGLYTLDGYLSSWVERYDRALEVVPPERLLVVRTDQLDQRLDDIAAFAGVPVDTLDGTRSHEYATKRRSGVLAELDADHVQDRVDHHCRDLMARFFPELVDVAPGPGGLRPGGPGPG